MTDDESFFKEQSLSIRFEVPSQDVAEGERLEKEGKWREAVDAYNKALGVDLRNAKAWWQLANIYMRFDRKADAVKCFESVVRLKPEAKALAEWLESYKGQGLAPRP